MVHFCNVNCHTMDDNQSELLGIKDPGKWLPFCFDMNMIEAAKLTSDDPEQPTYNCTTIFTHGGDTFVIDTPYKEFFALFKDYSDLFDMSPEDEEDDDDDDILL